jgi:triacylglycerol esterase/lipase EstA (alpha/beta hydrolase family)
MLARALRRLLVIELVIYAVLGWALVRYAAWPAMHAAALALGFALAVRALAVAATFAFAAGRASPMPAEYRIGVAGWLKLYFAELGAFVFLYNLYQAFDPLLMDADRLQPLAQGRVPVLLLHGYICNRGFMMPLRRYLEAHGVSTFGHDLEPVHADLDSYSHGLAQRIKNICAATGAGQVVIVAHSMGGLAARAYLRKHGAGRVAKLITLGTPHHGTKIARLGLGEAARQMVPGNAWLQQLNAIALAVPAVSVFSHHDNFVSPQDSAVLAGAKTVQVSGVGHLALAISRRIEEIVLEEIRR